MENKRPVFSGIDMAKGKDKTVYLLGLSPTLVNDLQCIADDNNEPLQETVFAALTFYVQCCEEVKKGLKIGAFKGMNRVIEYDGFYKDSLLSCSGLNDCGCNDCYAKEIISNTPAWKEALTSGTCARCGAGYAMKDYLCKCDQEDQK